MSMLSPSNPRLYGNAALAVSVLFGAPWVTALIMLALSARWRAWEIVAAGIFMDLLFLPGPPLSSMVALPFISLIALVLVIGLEPLRRELLLGPLIE